MGAARAKLGRGSVAVSGEFCRPWRDSGPTYLSGTYVPDWILARLRRFAVFTAEYAEDAEELNE